jgi:hypothetical protein
MIFESSSEFKLPLPFAEIALVGIFMIFLCIELFKRLQQLQQQAGEQG